MTPRVTIGLPVHNGETYLAATLDSILAQDLTDFELLISDNCSSDATATICEEYARRDARVRYLRSSENRGAAWNFSRLVGAARADLFKWSGYDDLIAPQFLSRCVQALAAEPRAVLAYPRTVIIDADGTRFGEYADRMDLRDPRAWRRVAAFACRINLCNPVFGVLRTAVLEQTPLIQPYISSDVPLLAELAARGMFVEVPEPLFYRRVHAGSSRQGHTTRAGMTSWFDPSRRGRVVPTRLRVFAGSVSGVARAPQPVHRRAATVGAYTAAHLQRRARVRIGAGRRALAARARGEKPPPNTLELIHAIERQQHGTADAEPAAVPVPHKAVPTTRRAAR